ncbi:mat-1-2 [Ophiostoma piceae UAMH 11346]|uniref:Mat-1-2 n=1 Tax=Ophiostoma piceae (strain UAMH 11346) TaxID=1262450 RepID=S3CDY9_OPHP1|nr:mat-1-2 [Ophiostoma piceae UAMH 11346]
MDMGAITPLMFNVTLSGVSINTIIDPSILAEFWATLSIQVMPGNDLIGIPGPTFRILDEGGKHYIAHNFASAIGEAMVKFVIDGSGTHPDRYLLGRATYFRPENIITSVGDLDVWVPSGYPLQSSLTSSSLDTSSLASTVSARRNSRGGAVKVPRPPNAYILYRKDNHKAVKQANPSLSNNDISVILGRRWNNEIDTVRVHYHKMAVEIKRQVEILHPHYKYNPRKPSEIRRRARSGNHGVYTVEGGQASDSSVTMPTPPLDFETASGNSLMSPSSDI